MWPCVQRKPCFRAYSSKRLKRHGALVSQLSWFRCVRDGRVACRTGSKTLPSRTISDRSGEIGFMNPKLERFRADFDKAEVVTILRQPHGFWVVGRLPIH